MFINQRKFIKRLFKEKKVAFVSLLILLGFIFTAIFAPYIAPYDYMEQDLAGRLSAPDKDHIFGRDQFGRDILSRVIYGSRISLEVGFWVVLFSSLTGTFIGAVSGFFSGYLDDFLMRIIDILLAFPGILLAIAIMAVLGPSLDNVILALCLIGWVSYARLARGEVLAIKEMEYIEAARSIGCSNTRIILLHIMPNILTPVIVQGTLGIAGVIVGEASLSFLGLGVQPPTPSWGSMLSEGKNYIFNAPHLTLFPGLAIMLVVMSLNFLGDGLRDLLNP
ncbi:ABC transporter permease, partial [bacterium]|nr:ABC transporter permease [bacterium]